MEIKFWYSECDRNIKEIFKLQNVFRIAKDEDRICDHDDKDGEMAGKESNKRKQWSKRWKWYSKYSFAPHNDVYM